METLADQKVRKTITLARVRKDNNKEFTKISSNKRIKTLYQDYLHGITNFLVCGLF